MNPPTLVVVSGGPGTGKTTLAHALACELGCPAIVRDEIKQGMVMATSGYRSARSDLLNCLTLETFFGVLSVLLRARVTVVAEAAYQDRLWRANLEPLADLAHLRVIRCTAPAATARDRIAQRAAENPHRAAHDDRELLEALTQGDHSLESFVPISLDVPTKVVDTSSVCAPSIEDIAAFARGGMPSC